MDRVKGLNQPEGPKNKKDFAAHLGFEDSTKGGTKDSPISQDIIEREKQEMKDFQAIFRTEVQESKFVKGQFTVESSDPVGGGIYMNEFDVINGKITGLMNYKEGTKGWRFSKVIYCQLKLVLEEANMSISEFDLKAWCGEAIQDDSTRPTIEKLQKDTCLLSFSCEAGTNEFKEISKTTTSKSKFELVEDHPHAFPGKRVKNIAVRYEEDVIKIDYNYE